MAYLQFAVYMTARVDRILDGQASVLASYGPADLATHIRDTLAVESGRVELYGLFGPDGRWIAGNLQVMPPGLKPGGKPVETPPSAAFAANARVIARRLPWGNVLAVGRDVDQLREIRAITLATLLWSGVVILLIGLVLGTVLSLTPLRRLGDLQAASRKIAAGDLKQRMPVSPRNDELDMLAATVNQMMDEIDRLISEIRGAGETLAHDLRTPLTRIRARLDRTQAVARDTPLEADIEGVVAGIDAVLDRFRALLRISELEARKRRAGVAPIDLADIAKEAGELFQPLAELRGVDLRIAADRAWTEADPKLLFEAVSNLVDNALKFTPPGGRVTVTSADTGIPTLSVQDNGPGIPADEQGAVLQRFYRRECDRLTPGSGLGLSIVAAIVRLHGFELKLENGASGLQATIECRPQESQD